MTTVNELMHRMVANLQSEGFPDPLHEFDHIAPFWADLCDLAQEPIPTEIAAILGEPLVYAIVDGPIPLPLPAALCRGCGVIIAPGSQRGVDERGAVCEDCRIAAFVARARVETRANHLRIVK